MAMNQSILLLLLLTAMLGLSVPLRTEYLYDIAEVQEHLKGCPENCRMPAPDKCKCIANFTSEYVVHCKPDYFIEGLKSLEANTLYLQRRVYSWKKKRVGELYKKLSLVCVSPVAPAMFLKHLTEVFQRLNVLLG